MPIDDAALLALQIQLAALKKARRTGLKRVRFGDREMEYRSDADMAKAIADLEDEITETETGTRRRRSFTTTTCKGL